MTNFLLFCIVLELFAAVSLLSSLVKLAKWHQAKAQGKI